MITRETKAQREKLEAETAKLYAEAAVQEYLAESARLQVDIDQWRRERSEVEHQMWALQPVFNREYWLTGYLTYATREHPDTIGPCMENLVTWSRFSPQCPIKLILNTRGGDTFAGMALFDFLGDLKSKGHYITIQGQGLVASMGSLLMQAGSWRTMGRESMMLVHEGEGSTQGSMGALQDSMILFGKITERIATIFINRSAGKISRADFLSRWSRKDWWLNATEALEMGFIDEVLP